MTSLDSNLIFYAWNADSPFHESALRFVKELSVRDDVAISELVLAEFYILLRNPAVLTAPLSAPEAVENVSVYRHHPRWSVLGFPGESVRLHDELWSFAAKPSFARRRIFDVRLALSLRYQGVTDFATVNTKDFQGFGLARIWNPLEKA